MPKRKTGYLRGLSRAAYNALQRYNRLAREDGMQALAPGKVKKEAKDKGMSAYEYIRKQEETNIAPRATKKEEAMIRKLRSIERRAGKVPTSTAAIRRSIAAAKAKKPRKGSRKRNAKDILSQLETKALDIVDPSSVKWLASTAFNTDANETGRALEEVLNGQRYVAGKGMTTAAFKLVKDALYDFRHRLEIGEFGSMAEQVAADRAIAGMARNGFVDVSLKFKAWQSKK